MALSGGWGNTVAGNYRLELEWSASQNTSNNSSTITVSLYWRALKRYGINSSVSKTASIGIAGNWTSTSGRGIAGLSGYEKKRLYRRTYTVKHNNEGEASVSLGAWFDAEVTLSGRYYGRISTGSRTITLDRIPRESTFSSSPNLTAGKDTTMTINRSSGSFSHKVDIRVEKRDGNREYIRGVEFNSNQTSLSTSFPGFDKEQIFQVLDGRDSANIYWTLKTYSGSTYIGQNTTKGTVSIAGVGAPSGYWEKAYSRNAVGGTVRLIWTRPLDEYSYDIYISFGSFKKHIKGLTSNSRNWDMTSTEAQDIYAELSNRIENTGTFRVTTYYGSTQVGQPQSKGLTLYVAGSEPVFKSGDFSYKDTNATTTSITGNNNYIIQNHSVLEVSLNSYASPQNQASMDRYVITVEGQSKTVTSTGTYSFGTINANGNIGVSIKAIDSRGKSTTATRTVSVLPYGRPGVSIDAQRLNNFQAETGIILAGGISELNVGGTVKNSVTSLKYRYKKKRSTSWSSWKTPTVNQGNGSYMSDKVTHTFDNTLEWDVQAQVQDELKTHTRTITINTGIPLLFIDSDMGSLGVGKFPEFMNAIETSGSLRAGNTSGLHSSLSRNDLKFNKDYRSFIKQLGAGSIMFEVNSKFPLEIHPNKVELENGSMVTGMKDYGDGHTEGHTLIQHKTGVVQFDGTMREYADITFPESFDKVFWVMVTAKNSQSTGYSATVFNITNSGCRVYLSHIKEDKYSFPIEFEIVAGGIKK